MTDTRAFARRIQSSYPRIWHACHRHSKVVTRDGGLTERESRVLVHLNDARFKTSQALGSHLGMAPSTLSEAIGALVEKGMVERRKRVDDARRVEFVLTEAGYEQLDASSPLDRARLEAALVALSPEHRRIAVEGVELLAWACGELSAETLETRNA